VSHPQMGDQVIANNDRPQEFPKSSSAYDEDSDEQESTVGKMPPSDSEEEV
jgi:hypothetical protein